MKVSVELEFLNVPQLNEIFRTKVDDYNKLYMHNNIYLEKSNYVLWNHSSLKDKNLLIQNIKLITEQYHEMARYALDEMNNVIAFKDKHIESHRTSG